MTKDPMKKKAARRRNYLKHREARLQYASAWSKTNPALRNEMRRRYRAKWKTAVLAKFNNRCNSCGFDNPMALQIDHVAGDGKFDRKPFSNGSTVAYLKQVLADTDNKYQLLCANCNLIKYYVSKT